MVWASVFGPDGRGVYFITYYFRTSLRRSALRRLGIRNSCTGVRARAERACGLGCCRAQRRSLRYSTRLQMCMAQYAAGRTPHGASANLQLTWTDCGAATGAGWECPERAGTCAPPVSWRCPLVREKASSATARGAGRAATARHCRVRRGHRGWLAASAALAPPPPSPRAARPRGSGIRTRLRTPLAGWCGTIRACTPGGRRGRRRRSATRARARRCGTRRIGGAHARRRHCGRCYCSPSRRLARRLLQQR